MWRLPHGMAKMDYTLAASELAVALEASGNSTAKMDDQDEDKSRSPSAWSQNATVRSTPAAP